MVAGHRFGPRALSLVLTLYRSIPAPRGRTGSPSMASFRNVRPLPRGRAHPEGSADPALRRAPCTTPARPTFKRFPPVTASPSSQDNGGQPVHTVLLHAQSPFRLPRRFSGRLVGPPARRIAGSVRQAGNIALHDGRRRLAPCGTSSNEVGLDGPHRPRQSGSTPAWRSGHWGTSRPAEDAGHQRIATQTLRA